MRKILPIVILSAAVSLFGFGCESQKPPTPVVPIIVPPAAIDPITATPTSTWKTYQDARVGFELQYPVTNTSTTWDPTIAKLDLSAFPLHEGHERSAQLLTRRVPGPPDACAKHVTAAGDTLTTGTLLEIGPNGFCLFKYSDAGAGHVADSYDYVTRKDDTEIILSFTDYHVIDPRVYEGCEPGTSKEPKCILFDEKIDTAIFRDIVETFAVITSQ